MGTKESPGDYDCYEHAEPDEPMFVLLARDPTAPEVVRTWIRRRRERLNELAYGGGGTALEAIEEIAQLEEAERCAVAMLQWKEERDEEKRQGDRDHHS